MHRLFWIAIAALVVVPACNNGNGLARVEVRGTVTYQGAPAKHGMIAFRPTHGSKGPAAGAAILDGKFLLPVDKGPIAGPHEVEIKIVDIRKETTKSGEPALELRNAVQLKTFSQKVEVTSGVNKFEFSFP